MDQAVDALIGAGYGSAGERCMAISVAVPVAKRRRKKLIEKLVPRVESLKIGPSTDVTADFGPLVTREALERVKVTWTSASTRAQSCWWTGAASSCRL